VLDDVLKLSDVVVTPSELDELESILELDELELELNSLQDKDNVFGNGNSTPS
jgi:hypothetical protein